VKRYVEFLSERGGSIVVEIDDEVAGGTVRAGRPGEAAEIAERTFEQAIGTIRSAAESIITQLRQLSDPPDQSVVEFGLKLSGKVNAVIASANSEANFKVVLTWKRPVDKQG
jgi:hypothetical protein